MIHDDIPHSIERRRENLVTIEKGSRKGESYIFGYKEEVLCLAFDTSDDHLYR